MSNQRASRRSLVLSLMARSLLGSATKNMPWPTGAGRMDMGEPCARSDGLATTPRMSSTVRPRSSGAENSTVIRCEADSALSVLRLMVTVMVMSRSGMRTTPWMAGSSGSPSPGASCTTDHSMEPLRRTRSRSLRPSSIRRAVCGPAPPDAAGAVVATTGASG